MKRCSSDNMTDSFFAFPGPAAPPPWPHANPAKNLRTSLNLGSGDVTDSGGGGDANPRGGVRDFFPNNASTKRKPSGNVAPLASPTTTTTTNSSSNPGGGSLMIPQNNNNNINSNGGVVMSSSPASSSSSATGPSSTTTTATTTTGRGRRVRTIYACAADHGSELSFEANQIIVNVKLSQEPGWLTGTLNGKEGLIPANYVEFLPDAAAT